VYDSSTGDDTESDIRRKPSNWQAYQSADLQDACDDDVQQDGRDVQQDGCDDSEDPCLDGLGNPNTSGITPPLPADLVEPNLASHENAIYVVTIGLEVGLFTNKSVFPCRFIVSLDTNLYSGGLQMLVFFATTPPLSNSRRGL
jgi:hypothetical protein